MIFYFVNDIFFPAIVHQHASAQELGGGGIHGNFEFNAQYYRTDSAIGAPAVPEKLLSNGFANFILFLNNK